ncbi:MAG: RNA polymerase factor sigma-70 [Pseudomonadales bacterium]|nr:RNA polymerase factor sigma-70 [Pseudomonadales bacterium]
MNRDSVGETAGTDVIADTAYTSSLREQMLKFATLQLTDPHLAEDAVQDALISAMNNVSEFAGRAAFKTWVFAILKNKIVDILRQRQRLVYASNLLREDEDEQAVSELFDRNGFWQPDDRPLAWSDPHQAFENAEFWQVFETCLENLPPKQAQVFMMREFVQLDSEEICASAGLTLSNLHVLLHRARLRLRDCLEMHWFKAGA